MKRIKTFLVKHSGRMVLRQASEPDVEPVVLCKVLPVRRESTFSDSWCASREELDARNELLDIKE